MERKSFSRALFSLNLCTCAQTYGPQTGCKNKALSPPDFCEFRVSLAEAVLPTFNRKGAHC
jgi:hypothetical protein